MKSKKLRMVTKLAIGVLALPSLYMLASCFAYTMDKMNNPNIVTAINSDRIHVGGRWGFSYVIFTKDHNGKLQKVEFQKRYFFLAARIMDPYYFVIYPDGSFSGVQPADEDRDWKPWENRFKSVCDEIAPHSLSSEQATSQPAEKQ